MEGREEIAINSMNTKKQFVGKRKCAIAIIKVAEKDILVNKMTLEEYFKEERFIYKIKTLLAEINCGKGFGIKVYGGGKASQVDAVLHGISRFLATTSEEAAKRLRFLGYLTRDKRRVERKKVGHKKARKSGNWKKR